MSAPPNRRFAAAVARDTDDVLVTEAGTSLVEGGPKAGAHQILLNRPKALNSLNKPMVRKLQPFFDKWAKNPRHPEVGGDLVIMKGAGGKAFCAGGDVVQIRASGIAEPSEGLRDHIEFFREEYVLNYTIGSPTTRQVALLNGVTMGGGVGLSVHGKWRVATDNTLFAMPETGIGFFCDVGGSYFLPRLEGELGMWLGLTGARLKGHDVYAAGVATHYVPFSNLETLEKELLVDRPLSSEEVEAILGARHKNLPPEGSSSALFNLSGDTILPWINRAFGKGSVEGIISELQAMQKGHDVPMAHWAGSQLTAMKRMSPTALKVVFRQLREGRQKSMADCFTMEYRISQRFQHKGSDFYEGVRALLVDRDNTPSWNPHRLAEVSDSYVDQFFQPLENDLFL